MSYTDTASLEAFLKTANGCWPLRETCSYAEASAKVVIHNDAGRIALKSVDDEGNQIGWTTFYPVPAALHGRKWDVADECAVDITFGR